MLAVTVGLTRPKEAFQPIFLAPGDNVDVKMGNALADTVVDCDEGAFGPKSLFDGTRQQLDVRKQRRDESGRKIGEGGDVFFRNEQAVSWKNRAMVQEGHGEFIFKHPVAR